MATLKTRCGNGACNDDRRAQEEEASQLGSKNKVDPVVWVKFEDMMENMRGSSGILVANQQLLELEDMVVVEDVRDEGNGDEGNNEEDDKRKEEEDDQRS